MQYRARICRNSGTKVGGTRVRSAELADRRNFENRFKVRGGEPFGWGMMSVRDLPSGSVSAVQGIHRAVERFDRAAATVAEAGPRQSNAAVVQISDEARAAALKSQDGDGFERGLIESMVAQHQLAANVRTLETSDEMTQALMDLLGRK
jgi:hypothetical protein